MGWIAKTFAIIGVIILLIIVIAGITAYQVVSLIDTITVESESMGTNMEGLMKGNCSKIAPVEESFSKIKSKATSACFNPIIKIAVDKMNQVPIKCSNITTLENEMNKNLEQIKVYCANQTAII